MTIKHGHFYSSTDNIICKVRGKTGYNPGYSGSIDDDNEDKIMPTAPLPLRTKSRVVTIDIQRNLKALHSIHSKLKPLLYRAGEEGAAVAEKLDTLDYELQEQVNELLLMHVEAGKRDNGDSGAG